MRHDESSPRRHPQRRWLAIGAALALLAAACGDDSATDDADPVTTDPAPSSSTPDDVTPDDDPEPDDTPDEPAPEVPAEPIVLGVAVSDVSQFAMTGPIAPRYQALADAANEAGGVAGRQVELIVQEWSLADTAGADAACIALTEDNDVFLVLGFMVPNFSDATCYTDRNDTIVLNATLVEPAEAGSRRLFHLVPRQLHAPARRVGDARRRTRRHAGGALRRLRR